MRGAISIVNSSENGELLKVGWGHSDVPIGSSEMPEGPTLPVE
jgi:hypothetical protein